MLTKENYKSLELTNTKTVTFKDDDECRFERVINSIFCYTFLLIEIESILPPTDCIFTLRFCTNKSNTVRTITLHSMEIRKDFIFENGLYILYLELTKAFHDIPHHIIPIDFKFVNKRDSKSLARLFYKITADAGTC
jgi:hypothetical protein